MPLTFIMTWKLKVKVAQSCLTLCNPMDYTAHGILQARILEWVAFHFFRRSSQPRDQIRVSCISGGFFTTDLSANLYTAFSSVQFSHSVVSDSLWPHKLQHARPPCPAPTPGVHSLTSIESVMTSSHLILCHPVLFLPPIHSSIRFFSMSQFFARGGQSIGVSALASVLPMNTQDWPPLEWTGWISLQSKGLSGVFSNTTVQKHQFFGTQLSSQSNSHIHTWPLEKP